MGVTDHRLLIEGSLNWASQMELVVKNQCRRPRVDPWVGKIPWRKKWQPAPVFWLEGPHGQGSLAGSMGSERVGYD